MSGIRHEFHLINFNKKNTSDFWFHTKPIWMTVAETLIVLNSRTIIRMFISCACYHTRALWKSRYLISIGLHIDSPLMSVTIFLSLLSKISGNISKHNRLHNGDSLRKEKEALSPYYFKILFTAKPTTRLTAQTDSCLGSEWKKK